MEQLSLGLRGLKNHWGPFPHACPECGVTVYSDSPDDPMELLCDDCCEREEVKLDALRKRKRPNLSDRARPSHYTEMI